MEAIELGLVLAVVAFIAAICIAAKFADVFYMDSGHDDDVL